MKLNKMTILILIFPALIFAQAPNISYSAPQILKLNKSIRSIKPKNKGGDIPNNVYGTVSTVKSVRAQAHNLAINPLATILYVGLNQQQQIVKLELPSGKRSEFVGSNGVRGSKEGAGGIASFNTPFGMAVHPKTGDIYVADQLNNKIRKITPAGEVTTFAGKSSPSSFDGPIGTSFFDEPVALAFNTDGTLYIFQRKGATIRQIDAAGTTVSTLATLVGGNGANPLYMAYFDGFLYVSELKGNQIDKVNVVDGTATILAGSGNAGANDGIGEAASFNRPCGITVDNIGNVYVADYENCKIRRITPQGIVSTVAGNGVKNASINGIGAEATFRQPAGLAFDGFGSLYVGDAGGENIRRVELYSYTIQPNLPAGLFFDNATGIISGKPLFTSPTTKYNITAYNPFGKSTATIQFAVVE